MSLISWFSSKPVSKPAAPSTPASSAVVAPGNASAQAPTQASSRKAERMERRELLYGVVRDAMTRAGVLSSSYKFKVLSLDSRGGNYLVMMDLASVAAEESGRLSEIETLIAHNARSRFDIQVTAVYWRLSDYVTTGLTAKANAHPAVRVPVASPASAPAMARAPAQAANRLDSGEILAFKNAFAASSGAAPLYASGEVMTSGRRSPQPAAPAEHIDHHDGEERMSPLSATQYGDLN